MHSLRASFLNPRAALSEDSVKSWHARCSRYLHQPTRSAADWHDRTGKVQSKMKTSWMPSLILLSAATALLSACGASYEEGSGEDAWQASDAEDGAAAEEGIALGTAEQGLTYPYCVSAASDP